MTFGRFSPIRTEFVYAAVKEHKYHNGDFAITALCEQADEVI